MMDPRCPRKLSEPPAEWCPLAVLRLKTLRNAGRELTEEEEAVSPGCPWAISHQLSCYCFFRYIRDNIDVQMSEVEIAHANSISVETVKKIERRAIDKIKDSDFFDQIKEACKEDGIYTHCREDEVSEYSILKEN